MAQEFKCEAHKYTLMQKSGGIEHVNHKLFYNGLILINELYSESWFIEKVSCTERGFEIIASHVQYNVPDKRTFLLNAISENEYAIK